MDLRKQKKRPEPDHIDFLDDLDVPSSIHPKVAPSLSQDDKFNQKLAEFKQPFVIPTLPEGDKLELNIVQTWGDVHYVGLTGIEVFDERGSPIVIPPSSIAANPSDINLLIGQGSDPRTVDKLVDQVNFTTDDFHAWLTPFTRGENHTITIQLPSLVSVSMIRIWNYNKSRIHSYRGARSLTCSLNDRLIFRGEIAKATGNTKDPTGCCEVILFTDSEALL